MKIRRYTLFSTMMALLLATPLAADTRCDHMNNHRLWGGLLGVTAGACAGYVAGYHRHHKGTKGDRGPRGETGPQGATGPTGPLSSGCTLNTTDALSIDGMYENPLNVAEFQITVIGPNCTTLLNQPFQGVEEFNVISTTPMDPKPEGTYTAIVKLNASYGLPVSIPQLSLNGVLLTGYPNPPVFNAAGEQVVLTAQFP